MAKPLLVVGNKNTSSWSMRPWLAMKVAGIEFEERLLLLDTPEFKRDIKGLSPNQRVPVLVVDGPQGKTSIWESLAICEWAAEQKPSLWPKDPLARAIARSVSNEMHAGFAHLRRACSMNLKEKHEGLTLSPEAGGDVHRVLELWRDCRSRFGKGGPFLFGEFTVADAMYAPVTTRFTTYSVPADDVGQAYIAAIQSLPAFIEWRNAALKE